MRGVVFLFLVGCSIASRGEEEDEKSGTGTGTGTFTGETIDETRRDETKGAEEKKAEEKRERVCPVGAILVAGGRLSTMERGRDVVVGDVCMDIHEVSVGEYASCVAGGRCRRQCNGTWHQVVAEGAEGEKSLQSSSCPDVPVRTDWASADENAAVSGFCNGNSPGTRADHPVNCVSFEEAMDYCAARGMRLPNGDEWEWASRGGPTKRVSPWGTAVVTDEICWGKPKKRTGTCARGSHPKDHTPQGLEEMGGSVTEWVTAPNRNAKGKVRWAYGASWYAVDDGYARAALGGMQFPARRAETVGFRCAADPKR